MIERGWTHQTMSSIEANALYQGYDVIKWRHGKEVKRLLLCRDEEVVFIVVESNEGGESMGHWIHSASDFLTMEE